MPQLHHKCTLLYHLNRSTLKTLLTPTHLRNQMVIQAIITETHWTLLANLTLVTLMMTQNLVTLPVHLDDYTIEFPPPPCKAQPPCNPLLSEEEDEFLHHVSRIFENLSKIELTNAIH